VKLGAKIDSCNAYIVRISIVGNVLRLQQPQSIRSVVKVHNSAPLHKISTAMKEDGNHQYSEFGPWMMRNHQTIMFESCFARGMLHR
jgi:frataxin-like iron-binding protein CyaY